MNRTERFLAGLCVIAVVIAVAATVAAYSLYHGDETIHNALRTINGRLNRALNVRVTDVDNLQSQALPIPSAATTDPDTGAPTARGSGSTATSRDILSIGDLPTNTDDKSRRLVQYERGQLLYKPYSVFRAEEIVGWEENSTLILAQIAGTAPLPEKEPLASDVAEASSTDTLDSDSDTSGGKGGKYLYIKVSGLCESGQRQKLEANPFFSFNEKILRHSKVRTEPFGEGNKGPLMIIVDVQLLKYGGKLYGYEYKSSNDTKKLSKLLNFAEQNE